MAKLPDSDARSLWGEVKKILQRLKSLENRSPFFGTGMKPDGNGGIQSNDFDGDLSAGNAGTKGWAMNAVRAAFGELFLRPGSVGNDALANPVDGKVGKVSASNFALTAGSFVELAGQNIVVPAGFTQCLAVANSSAFSYNPNTTGGSNGAGGDAIYCYVALAGMTSHPNPVGVSGSGGYATSFSNTGFELTGLTPGSTIRLSVYACSAYQGLAANVDNYAEANASLTWLR